MLSDEREQEREEEIDNEALEEVPGVASLKTSESEKSVRKLLCILVLLITRKHLQYFHFFPIIKADKLIEALDIYRDKPDSHPLMLAYGAKTHDDFILRTLNMIKASELEQSIMLLPVAYVKIMTNAINDIFEKYPLATEGAFRCLHSLMKFHRVTLSGSADRSSFKSVADKAETRCKELQDIVGFNLAALGVIQNRKQDEEKIQTFKEMVNVRKRKRKTKEKALKRALLMV